MGLATPQSAILSAVIFNALIIIALIPLALRGVRYRPVGAAQVAARQPVDLRAGRPDRAVHRHQADRHDFGGAASGVKVSSSLRASVLRSNLRVSLRSVPASSEIASSRKTLLAMTTEE